MPGSSPGMTIRTVSAHVDHPTASSSALSFLTLAAPAHARIRPHRLPIPVQKHHLPVFRLRQAEHAPLRHQPRWKQGRARPADCDLDYGGAFEMNAKGPAVRICHGDTVMDKSLPVLGLWRGVAARRVHVHVGTDGHHVLQCGPARVLAGASEAGYVLSDARQCLNTLVILREGGVSSTHGVSVDRNCSGILDPRLRGDDGGGEDAHASLNHRHMPRHIARHRPIEPRIVDHFDLPAEGTKARALVESER